MFDDTTRNAPEPMSGDDDQPLVPEGPGSEIQSTSSRTRYRDAAMSWLALGALLAAWHMEARLERPPAGGMRLASVRDDSQRSANQLWLTGATRARSWIARAPTRVAAKTVGAVISASGVDVDQPEWSSLASVRTARRWLGSTES
jgi:hypothetical protein